MAEPKLLLISYLFPPNGGIGVQRALSLAKYLPQCGIEVHILKAANASGPVRDPELLKEIPAEVRVHSAFAPEVPFALRHRIWGLLAGTKKKEDAAVPAPESQGPAPSGRGLKGLVMTAVKRILSPEPEVLWAPFAIRKAAAVVRKHRIDVVMVTAPPFSAFLVGNALKRRFPHLKLISDFRDEWLKFYLKDFSFQSGEYTRRKAERIERQTVELSDAVVAVTRSTLDEMKSRYPELPPSKFVCVPNGYDPELFKDFHPRAHEGEQVVITHAGTLYTTSSPRWYLDALDELPQPERDAIETRFIGRVTEEQLAYLQSRLSPVKIVGFLPQSQALRSLEETDYLLLTLTDGISLPGKLFEYLATGKRIVALSQPGGEVDRLLRETGGGWSVDATDRKAVQELIRHAVGARHDAYHPDWEAIRSYERPRLAAEYAKLMQTLLGINCTEQRKAVQR